MNGIPVRLFDTAGLRSSGDEIEKEGILRSKELMDDADLVVYVIAPGETEPEEKMTNAIYIHSKSDIAPGDGISFSSLT